jgi:hypothetical protein
MALADARRGLAPSPPAPARAALSPASGGRRRAPLAAGQCPTPAHEPHGRQPQQLWCFYMREDSKEGEEECGHI